MKIGVQILAYNCEKSFPSLIEPWVNLKEELNFSFWVGSGQFKIYKELGYEDLNQSTIALLSSQYESVIDHLFIPDPDNLLSDHEMRSQSLDYFKQEDVDLIWILDADEFYTEREIREVVNYVANNSQYDYYNIQFKNFVKDRNLWTDFNPVRLFHAKRFRGVKEHYFDNHFSYNDGSEYRDHQGIDIPKEYAFPIHYSWVYNGPTGPKSLKEKIEYQKQYYVDGCGYQWDCEKNEVTFSNGFSPKTYSEPNVDKCVILSPTCGGKTRFFNDCKYWYRGVKLFCGECESTSRNYIDGTFIGGISPILPESHPLYLGWNELYKIGIKWFEGAKWNFGSILCYNMPNHIPYLRDKFSNIDIKVVLPEESIHRENFIRKYELDDEMKKSLIELIKEESDVLRVVSILCDWKYVLLEREEYTRLANIYNVPIYTSMDSALQSMFV